MPGDPRVRFLQSVSARERLDAALRFVRDQPVGTEVLLVGATREAVDDFVREVTGDGATFGLHRFSFWQLVSSLAAVEIATERLAPATVLAAQSVAARCAFEARERGSISRLAEVSSCPGFPAALQATLEELRLDGIGSRELRAGGEEFSDLAALADLFEQEVERARIADRPALLKLATWAWRRPQHASLRRAPILLLDLPQYGSLGRDFLASLWESAPSVLATLPAGDERARRALISAGAEPLPFAEGDGDEDALARLRRWIFSESPPPEGERDDSVRFLSAPGEARECAEIARLMMRESRRGVRFDEMAVFVRAPELHSTHLETALRRARIPAYFARGTHRPDPAGRAFLALLACAQERLSARRFAEYLSFAQVPVLTPGGEPPAETGDAWVPARDDSLPLSAAAGAQLALPFAAPPAAEPPPDPAAPQIGGTLRAPWKWERLLVEASVAWGRDRGESKERWHRRLSGLARELELKRGELVREGDGGEESPRVRGIHRQIEDLRHLERFSLPVVDALAALPQSAVWGEWLSLLEALAPRVLRRPQRVLEVLAELRPMSTVGPAGLDEVREVLAERLSLLEENPPATRYGSVFVGTPESARGRSFRVVFAPGLAERVFPRRPREDPLLLDDARRRLSESLRTQADRDEEERLRLRLVVGAAAERCILSYPRLEVAEARPRVPSFYGMDVLRAVRGALPAHEELVAEAEREVHARLAWPAPPEPEDAIDPVDHDLAVLHGLLHAPRGQDTRGRARYLLELNEHLARSLRTRWARWHRQWGPRDGLLEPGAGARAALDANAPSKRPYSVTALENFAACPYRFLLSAVHRLEPREEPVAPVRLDPLTRGSLVHETQARALRAMRKADTLPVTQDSLARATRLLDETLDEVAARYEDDIAPAIDRVWRDEIEHVRADLRIWLRRIAESDEEWVPAHFELTFGLPAERSQEPGSTKDPVELPGGWRLRGAIDMVERSRDGGALRVTDHKTGGDRTDPGFVVGGGEVLQPVLYSMVAERILETPVTEARLSFCTSRGGFQDRTVEINDWSRLQGRQALDAIARALKEGVLVPAPRGKTERRAPACSYCDFRPVCGPNEAQRIQRKEPGRLEELAELRKLP